MQLRILKFKLRCLFFCLMLRSSLNNEDGNEKLFENPNETAFDRLNEHSDDLETLSASLNNLRDLMLIHSTDSGKSKLSDVIPARESNSDFDEATQFEQDAKERSQYLYIKAKSMLSSSMIVKKDEAFRLLKEASLKGSCEARGEIAWASLFGVHLPQNISAAVDLFEELAAVGHPEGHTGMAFLCAVGLGRQRSEQRALIHYTIAALGGSIWARMALGYRYWYGLSVSPDCEKALQFYKPVADNVVKNFNSHESLKNNRISIFNEDDQKNFEFNTRISDIKDFYEMLAESGDVHAQFSIGHMYYYGTMGLQRDTKKALYYFKMASKNKNMEATAFIGRIYMEGGENTKVNYEEAYKHFYRAAFNENPVGEAGLASMYLEGKHVEKDYRKAFHFMSRSAQKGWVEGIIELGKMYYNGIGSVKDYQMARKYFHSASEAGHVVATHLLGKMTEVGLGGLRSCTAAAELFKQVAEKGSWDSLFTDAFAKYKQRRYKEAFVMYSLLAELGYSAGQVSAALLLDDFSFDLPLLDTAEEAPEDPQSWLRSRSALRYWKRALGQGDHRVLNRIGDHYFYGRGTLCDYETALSYYRWAGLRENNAEAMYNVGYMHAEGLGLPRDSHLASRAYHRAVQLSEEAWAPVGLALVKLNLSQSFASFKNWDIFKVLLFDKLMKICVQYWDVLIVILLGVTLKYLLVCRRAQM